jgi:glycosyltransferase involved in cell wall biosynthesis
MEYIAESTLKNSPTINKLCLPPYLLSAYLALASSRTQLIHTHLAIPLGTIAAYNPQKTPQLITCHGSDITHPTENKLYQPITRKTLRKADHIATVSKYIHEKAIQLGAEPAKTETIYLGVNTDHFKPSKQNNPTTIGTLGRLVAEKNIDEILIAAKHLQKKLDIRLRIGGDGPDRERLQKLATNLDIKAEFTGRVHNNLAFHQSLDVFVLASRREGLSISLQEAMSCGTTPVAVNGYSSNEIIQDQVNGYLYQAGNHQALAEKIQQAIENKPIRRAARTTIKKRFNAETATRRYIELYREMGIS